MSGLGPTAAFVSGWALLLAYAITTSAVLCGFINFSNVLLRSKGINIPLVILGIVGAISAWYVAYKDIKLSANLTLILEGICLISISILGFIGSSAKLNAAAAPLDTIANINSVGFFGPIISIGSMLSFWASFLACANAGARVLFSLEKHGIVNASMGNVHQNNNTPNIAISVISLIATLFPIILIALNNIIFDIYGWLGTIATYGFLLNYALITIAAPVYLYKEKELKIKDIIISVITLIILLIPIVGSVYPLAAYPYNIFPFIFLAWLVAGGIWFMIQKARKPGLVSNIKTKVHLANEQFKVET